MTPPRMVQTCLRAGGLALLACHVSLVLAAPPAPPESGAGPQATRHCSRHGMDDGVSGQTHAGTGAGAQTGRSAPGAELPELHVELCTPRQHLRFRVAPDRVVQFPSDHHPAPTVLRPASQQERHRLKQHLATRRNASATSAAPVVHGGEDGNDVSPLLIATNGQRYGLPGGVLVTFRDALPTEEARDLLLAHRLTPLQQFTPRLWKVQSPAGLASLELANQLNASGDFLEATPVWWNELSPP